MAYSGYGAASTKKRQYIIDNVNDGFDLYNMENGIFLRNFPTGTPIKRLPKQVGFGEEAKVVVGGTDHGVVYVFDRKRGARLDTLDHGNKHLIQAITVSLGSDTDRQPLTVARLTARMVSIQSRVPHLSPGAKTASICGRTARGRGRMIRQDLSNYSSQSSGGACIS